MRRPGPGGYDDTGRELLTVSALALGSKRWVELPAMSHPRMRFAAATLPPPSPSLPRHNGSAGSSVSSTGTSSPSPPPSERWSDGGEVVVAGGDHDEQDLRSAELFDLRTHRWHPLPDMPERCGCTMSCCWVLVRSFAAPPPTPPPPPQRPAFVQL